MAGSTRAVYLFGSAVRGELTKESDIDLFFDCEKRDEEAVRRLTESGILKFEHSKDYEKWKLFKFVHPFSVQAGDVRKWDLKTSIASEGIILYGKRDILGEGERHVLFTIKYSKKKKEYIKLKRLLFGRTEKEYSGKGLVDSLRGIRIGPTAFLIPQEERSRIKEILTKEKVDFSMKDVITLE